MSPGGYGGPGLAVAGLPAGATQALQQDPTDPNKWHVVQLGPGGTVALQPGPAVVLNSAPAPASEQAPAPPRTRLRRVACTCPNCKDGEKGGRSGAGEGGPRKKQHICHMPGCNKVR